MIYQSQDPTDKELQFLKHLERFQNVAVSLRKAGDLHAVGEVDVETDEHSIIERLSILKHSFDPYYVELGNRAERE